MDRAQPLSSANPAAGFLAGQIAEHQRVSARASYVHRASECIELVVRLDQDQDTPGAALGTLMARGLRVLAYSLHRDCSGEKLLLVAEDSWRARRILEQAGFLCRSDAVALVESPRRVGVAAQLGARLTMAGIGVIHSYVSWSEGENVFLVFKTTDNRRALRELG